MSRALTRIALGAAIAALHAAPLAAASEDAVSQQRLRADVETMVSFGTRHTLSEQDNPKRGIGAARRWAEGEFRKIARRCGDCLEIALPETMVSGPRIPEPVRLVNVVAIQHGTERPNEVVIVQGHIDSRVTDVMDATSDAPGANDDASGVALVIEAARALSLRSYPVTIVYAALSGEEQGLFGGRLLADYAKEQGWQVKAVLNNDIVGGSCGSDGYCDDKHVRVFSEGPRADATDALRAQARRYGGENDSPSRNLSRYVAALAEATEQPLAVRQIWRADRMGRGGDHLPFNEAGVAAIRFSVAVEDYEHQHQDLRSDAGVTYGDTVDEMDFAYLAKVTQLNIAALDALASAPMPPAPKVEAAVQTFTRLSWEPVDGAASYRIYSRPTDTSDWDLDIPTEVSGTEISLEGVRGDDWLFGVSAVSKQGAESPIASAVPGGAFTPLE
ncbi:MAG: M28 family metallopeptidase [Sphingomonadaceae bacterium]